MKLAVVETTVADSRAARLVALEADTSLALTAFSSSHPLAGFDPTLAAAPEGGLCALLEAASRQQAQAATGASISGEKCLLSPLPDRARVLVLGSRRFPTAPTTDMPLAAMLKFRTAFTEPDSVIALPDSSNRWDVDVVLGAVLGHSVFRANEQEAADAIAGWCLILDVTERDRFEAEAKTNNGLMSKNHRGLSAIGPCIWIPDQEGQAPGPVELRINGETKQRFSLGDLSFSAARAIAHWSASRLGPGDVIGLGPAIWREGSAALPPAPIKAGDRIEAHCAEIGSLGLHVATNRNGAR